MTCQEVTVTSIPLSALHRTPVVPLEALGAPAEETESHFMIYFKTLVAL